jgi:hypothetical protein
VKHLRRPLAVRNQRHLTTSIASAAQLQAAPPVAVPAVDFVQAFAPVKTRMPRLLAVVLALAGLAACEADPIEGPGRPMYPVGAICRAKVPCETLRTIDAGGALQVDGGAR